MTSTSDRPGYCLRCGCANGNHDFGACQGKDKEGSSWKQCDFEWARCTTGGHSSDIQYVDCFRCWKHPGAPPKHFWGTQPDDEESVPTADNLSLPWPATAGTVNDTIHDAGPSYSGHNRSLSNESIDPLQWSQARFQAETGSVTGLVQSLSQVRLQDNAISSESSVYVSTYYSKHQRVYFQDPNGGKEIKTRENDWASSNIDYRDEMVPCLLYVCPNSGRQFYTWELGDGEHAVGSGSGKKSKSKDKRGHRR